MRRSIHSAATAPASHHRAGAAPGRVRHEPDGADLLVGPVEVLPIEDDFFRFYRLSAG